MCLEFLFITRQGQLYNVEVNTTNGPLGVSSIISGNKAQYNFDKNIPGSNGPFYGVANVPEDSTGFTVLMTTGYSGQAIPVPPVTYQNFTADELPNGNGSSAVSQMPPLPILSFSGSASNDNSPEPAQAPSSSAALVNSWIVGLVSIIGILVFA